MFTMQSTQTSKPTKYKVALWTPLPPLKTGIADYVAELLPYLANYFDLEIFVEVSYSIDDGISQNYKVFPYHRFTERNRNHPFDLNIYQMGNNDYHSFIYNQALIVPGLVVLHDLSLSLMLYHHFAGIRNDIERFRKEFLFSEGEKALQSFNLLYNKGDNEAIMDFFSNHHMLRRLIGRNYAVVSHLEYCAKIAKKKYGASRVYNMYLGSPDPMIEMAGMSKQEARLQLNIPKEQFVVGVFGFLQPNKQNDVMVRALARIKARYPDTVVMFVGEMNPALDYDRFVKDLIRKLKLENNVRLTGFAPRNEMQKYYIASDVVINLRYPSFGQMSATLSRGIATGRPVIITDLPEWDFFPETFCWRVSPNDTEGREIANLVCRLIENPSELEQRSASAREFFLESGTSEKAAENLTEIIRDVIVNHSEQVSLEVDYQSPDTLKETIKIAFENWSILRAGGTARYKFDKLRKIPIIGPLIVYSFVLVLNIINMRTVRRAEWILLKNLVDEINWLDSQIREFEPEPIRILDNPLGWVDYHPRHPETIEQFGSDDFFYLEFEKAFRGSETIIRRRQQKVFAEIKSYASLEENAPVLDVGCGRGEFLALMQREGLHPVGVDTNKIAINGLKEKGFEVYAQDLFSYLSSVPDGFFKGITSFHVIEHLTHEQIMKFLSLAYQKLMPDGFIYLETPNPLCLHSLSRFYTDPTHQKPIQPFQLSFLLEYSYFRKVRLLFLEPAGQSSANFDTKWITLYQDYGVLAMKQQEK